MKLYNKRDSQKDRCAWIEGHPVSRPETEIVQASVVNNFSIGIRVGDLHVIGHGLGLLRGLVSHVLVLLTDSVHVDLSATLLDLREGTAGPSGGSAGLAAGWRATSRGTVGVRVEGSTSAGDGGTRRCNTRSVPDATGRLGVEARGD